jgi:hypothetical protein
MIATSAYATAAQPWPLIVIYPISEKMRSMTVSQSGGGGLVRVLGIIYLIRLFQVRRRRRREERAAGEQREK